MREEKSKWRVVDRKRTFPIRTSPLIKLRRGSRCESAGAFRPREAGGGWRFDNVLADSEERRNVAGPG